MAIDQELPLRDGMDFYRSKLLQTAIKHFQIALQMEEKSWTSHLNLASAYLLNKEYEQAEQLFKQLQILAKLPEQQAALLLLKGIGSVRQNNKKQGKFFFEQALQHNKAPFIKAIAQHNLNALKGIFKKKEHKESIRSAAFIKGIDLTYQNDMADLEIPLINSFAEEHSMVALKQFPKTLYFQISSDIQSLALVRTTEPSERLPNQLGVGSTISQIKAAFPQSISRTLKHSQGYYLCYPARKLVFRYNAKGQVVEWGTFEHY